MSPRRREGVWGCPMKRRIWLPVGWRLFAVCVAALSCGGVGGSEPTPLPAGGATAEPIDIARGTSRVVSYENLAWIVHSRVDDGRLVIVATFRLDAEPIPPVPVPGTVAGVVILENQEDRTAKQAAVMDDPTWQAAAKAKGLTWKIEDKDVPADQAPWMSVLLNAVQEGQHAFPVVCLVDADGKPVQVLPLPATAEEMLKLIGGVE